MTFPSGDLAFHNPEKPINNSPNNTGIKELPPAQPAFIGYTHGQSARFPVLNAGGGRTAMAGPVYYFDKNNKSATKLPAENTTTRSSSTNGAATGSSPCISTKTTTSPRTPTAR